MISQRYIVVMCFPVICLVLGTLTGAPQGGLDTATVSRISHVLPEGQQFTIVGSPLVALSPDGSRMVYVANRQFYLMAIDTLVSRPIPGSDVDPSDPFFSPDGEWVGYWSQTDSQLKKIAVNGGAPVTLADTSGDPLGRPIWRADGTIVWGQSEQVLQVSANGGTPEVVIEDSGAGLTYGPRILPAVPGRGSRRRRRCCAVAGIRR